MKATFKILTNRSHIVASMWLLLAIYIPDYLLIWLQSGLYGLCGLFKPQIIRFEATNNPHFITRLAWKIADE